MQVLEKIMQEIEKRKLDVSKFKGATLRALAKQWNAGIDITAEIIRSHVENEPVSNPNKLDDGWIPVEERLPTQKEYLKDDGRFMLDDGNRRYQGFFDIYEGKFKFPKYIGGVYYQLIEDKCVIAWQLLPEPYKPKLAEMEGKRK